MPTAATPPRAHPLVGLAGWIVLTLAAGVIGSLASRSAPELYARLDQPAWAPPPAVFGPVWTALYLMIAVAAWLVWRESGSPGRVRAALALFGAQLVLNAAWSWLFFAWRMGGAAVAEILVLWALIAATLVAFWRVRRLAGLLLVPYLAWVTFAAALTAALWRRNPTLR